MRKREYLNAMNHAPRSIYLTIPTTEHVPASRVAAYPSDPYTPIEWRRDTLSFLLDNLSIQFLPLARQV